VPLDGEPIATLRDIVGYMDGIGGTRARYCRIVIMAARTTKDHPANPKIGVGWMVV
jgi:hypothetical protein